MTYPSCIAFPSRESERNWIPDLFLIPISKTLVPHAESTPTMLPRSAARMTKKRGRRSRSKRREIDESARPYYFFFPVSPVKKVFRLRPTLLSKESSSSFFE